ncbi:eCIS core domain-containing protein [Undibacterium sp. Ji49W]|uniref:eCIS core domain-containing protein n=1 Tax=Undibacterium sp. Ji49W TaxID=3413040 RepID=UPI003BF0490A
MPEHIHQNRKNATSTTGNTSNAPEGSRGQRNTAQLSQESAGGISARLIDHRSQAIAQRQLQDIGNNSPQARQLKAYGQMMQNSPSAMQLKALQAMMHKPLLQRAEDDEALQTKPASQRTAQLAGQADPKPNNTGLPNQLKAGIESLSGMSMDHVKVNYNSGKPAQLNAHAYAQGSEIHVAPGQEQHVPHEAWHVVQQAQGRVRPTMQMKQGVAVNDDVGLEAEADVMGAKAIAEGASVAQATGLNKLPGQNPVQLLRAHLQMRSVLQGRGAVAQLTLKEALIYYNRENTGGITATQESEVDLQYLTPGRKGHYTKLKNKPGPVTSGVKKRKVGSANGPGGYRLQSPRQIRVRYGSSKARFVRSERKARHVKSKYSGYNYATAKVVLTNRLTNNKTTVYITRSSKDATSHSEGAIINVIKYLLKNNSALVKWVYTEREACGKDNHNCRGDKKLGDGSLFDSDIPIYYSVDWPDSVEEGSNAKKVRKEGTNLLKRIDTQVGKSTAIHNYDNEIIPTVDSKKAVQIEDDNVDTSDDESDDERDVLQGGYEKARKDYKEI